MEEYMRTSTRKEKKPHISIILTNTIAETVESNMYAEMPIAKNRTAHLKLTTGIVDTGIAVSEAEVTLDNLPSDVVTGIGDVDIDTEVHTVEDDIENGVIMGQRSVDTVVEVHTAEDDIENRAIMGQRNVDTVVEVHTAEDDIENAVVMDQRNIDTVIEVHPDVEEIVQTGDSQGDWCTSLDSTDEDGD
jgi:hypothetical protein